MLKRRLYYISVILCVLVVLSSFTLIGDDRIGVGALIWFIVMGVLPFLLIVYFLKKSIKGEVGVNENYINEIEGIYRHELRYKKNHYFLELNEKENKMTIKENALEAVIPFSDIKEWGYVNDQGSKYIGGNTISSHIDAKNKSDKSAQDAWMNKTNGFNIKTKSLSNPVWNIKFLPENNSTIFHKDSFWLDVKKQSDIWMNIFNKVLNKQ